MRAPGRSFNRISFDRITLFCVLAGYASWAVSFAVLIAICPGLAGRSICVNVPARSAALNEAKDQETEAMRLSGWARPLHIRMVSSDPDGAR